MTIPQFKSQEEANKYYIQKAEETIARIESSKTPEEKLEIYLNFSSDDFNLDEQPLGDYLIKDYKEYQDIKNLIFDFLNWLETNKGINVFQETQKDSFGTENQNFKMPLMVPLILAMQSLPKELQVYMILNLFRTLFELNRKHLDLVFYGVLKKEGKSFPRFFEYWEKFLEEFKEYSRIKEIRKCFINDLRNAIAHEDWFLEGDNIRVKSQGYVESYKISDISLWIHNLFFFRVAFMKFIIKSQVDLVKNKKPSAEQINLIIESLKLNIKELKTKLKDYNSIPKSLSAS